MAAADVSGAELGRRINRTTSAVNDIIRGKSQGGYSIHDIARALSVDVEWLRDGTGPAPVWMSPSVSGKMDGTAITSDQVSALIAAVQTLTAELQAARARESAMEYRLSRLEERDTTAPNNRKTAG